MLSAERNVLVGKRPVILRDGLCPELRFISLTPLEDIFRSVEPGYNESRTIAEYSVSSDSAVLSESFDD